MPDPIRRPIREWSDEWQPCKRPSNGCEASTSNNTSTDSRPLIEFEKAPKGLSEDTVRFISAKKNEPAWMLEWRLEAYRRWLTMTEPKWARVNYPKIDYQDLYYYSAPKPKKEIGSLDELDPEILKTYEKLGIPLREVEMLEGVVQAREASAASRSMPCSIRSRWRPPSRRS